MKVNAIPKPSYLNPAKSRSGSNSPAAYSAATLEKKVNPMGMHFDAEGNPLDKSYDSMASDEKDPIHYEMDSDNEPPKDEIGDEITVVKKGQVTKKILEVRESEILTHPIVRRRSGKTRSALRGDNQLCRILFRQRIV